MIYYRHSFDVAGYVFFADIYCADCGVGLPETDPEGNAKGVIFVDGLNEFQNGDTEYQCGQCGLSVNEW